MKPKLNNIYTIGIGYYKGEKMLLTWISPSANIGAINNKLTQAYGVLINNKKKKINTILEFLTSDEPNYKNLSKLSLIKLIKRGDKKAKKEFIIRFKSVPKF